MQAQTLSHKTNPLLFTLLSLAGLAAAITLFVLVLNHLGLFNRFKSQPTAVSSPITQTTKDMQFGQAIEIQAGTAVELRLDNRDLYGHSFDVDALDLHVAMQPNAQTNITFTPTTPGTYEIYCAIPGHRAAGMVSTLIVKP